MSLSTPYSPKCLEKLSEKGRKGLQRSPTDHPRAYFFLPIPAKFTLGALLVPLFGQFQKVNSRKLETSGVRCSRKFGRSMLDKGA